MKSFEKEANLEFENKQFSNLQIYFAKDWISENPEQSKFGKKEKLPAEFIVKPNTNLSSSSSMPENSAVIKAGIVDSAGTLSAGFAGPVAWSIMGKTKYGMVAKIFVAALAGATSRTLVKGGAEHLILPPVQHTCGKADLALGAVDAFAGVSGSCVESYIAQSFVRHLGFKYGGSSLTHKVAEKIGQAALDNSVFNYITFQTMKGLGSGAASSLVWNLPRAVNKYSGQPNDLKKIQNILYETTEATFIGALISGVAANGAACTTNSKELFLYGKAAVFKDKNISKIDILHFNDMHSALLGKKESLPQLASEVERLRAVSRAKKQASLLFELGDNYSGNVVAGHTDVGYVETKAIQMMRPHAVIPGNHVADAGNGKVDIASWVKNIHQIEKENGESFPGLATNIKLSQFPDFIANNGPYKPARIIEIDCNKKKEKIGLIGLVTQELQSAAGDSVLYENAEQSARKAIADMNKQGINKIVVLSHLGRAEDLALAKNVKGISAIIGGHSHDIEPGPFWIKNHETGADVPVVQAGEKARYLGELNLAIKANGFCDKYRSSGRLHKIHEGISPHPEIYDFVQEKVGKVAKLAEKTYPALVEDHFHIEGIRGEEGQQTPLATLICKALLSQVNHKLSALNSERAQSCLPAIKPLSILLKHSGDIRAGISPGSVDHLTLSNVFLNTGNPERELGELAVAQLSGEQIKRALNFGIHDLPASTLQTGKANLSIGNKILQMAKSIMTKETAANYHDYSGNFLHVEGLRYSFDRSLPPGNRVVDLRFIDPLTAKELPLKSKQVYDVLTLFHPLEKWAKKGILTSDIETAQYNRPENWVFEKKMSAGDIRKFVNASAVKLSQVDLLSDYLVQKSKVSSTEFNSNAVIDLSHKPSSLDCRPQLYPLLAISSLSAIAAARAAQQILNKKDEPDNFLDIRK